MNGYIADNGKSIEYFIGAEAAEKYGTDGWAPVVLPEGVYVVDAPEGPVSYFDGAQKLDFASDSVAAEYARTYKTCLTDEDNSEVFCNRWDH